MGTNKFIFNKKDISACQEMDSVAQSKKLNSRVRATDILLECKSYWMNMDKFRRDRLRNKRYVYGDQWKDKICVNGQEMTEERYIESHGNIPLKNNLIRRLVNSILGVYRSQKKEPICYARDRDEQGLSEAMSVLLKYNTQLNRMDEINSRTLEEFLISGFVVHRKWYGWRNNKIDCWTDYVNPANFFIDTNMKDFRGWDVRCMGELHDISINELYQKFAHTPEDYQRLKEIYQGASDRRNLAMAYNDFGYYNEDVTFMLPNNPNLCRVIEVWRKESKPRLRCHDWNTGEIFKIDIEDYDYLVGSKNNERIQQGIAAGMNIEDIPLIATQWFVDDYWYYYFLSPYGDILDEGISPYDHKEYPYVFKAYPFIDGEIHSFASEVIDQQRYVNRLITLYDWVMRSSAKGVLLFPEELLPKDMDLQDVADEWTRFDGVIAIKAKPGIPMPQQISVNATNIGINELLGMQLKFFEDISGVHGALQGKPGFSGMSASLYAQQTQNSTTTLLDIMETFSTFVVDAAYKDVKNIQQFYGKKKVLNIVGTSANDIKFSANAIKDVEFDLNITESISSPVYRQLQNDFLLQIWQAGQITIEQVLENGAFPFADKLLKSIKEQKAELEKQQQEQMAMQQQLALQQQNQGGEAPNPNIPTNQ